LVGCVLFFPCDYQNRNSIQKKTLKKVVDWGSAKWGICAMTFVDWSSDRLPPSLNGLRLDVNESCEFPSKTSFPSAIAVLMEQSC
jgi:hypothetical protein